METKELLEKQFERLPEILQHNITHSGWERTLDTISQGQNLDPEQKEKLETETLLVLFGFEPISSYAKNVEEKVGLSPEKTSKVTNDVYELIFSPISDTLDSFVPDLTSEEEEQKQPAPKPAEPEIQNQQIKESLPSDQKREEIKQPGEVFQENVIETKTEQQDSPKDLAEENQYLEIMEDEKPEEKEDNLESKDSLMREIEHPTKTESGFSQKQDIHKEKLQKIVTMPHSKEEAQSMSEPEKESGYKNQDPYREPIE